MRVSLHHLTRYAFDRPVSLSPHVVRLRPAPHCRTHLEAYSIQLKPSQHFLNWQQDPFGNYQARLVFPEPTGLLEIEVDLLVDLIATNPFDLFLEKSAEKLPLVLQGARARSPQTPVKGESVTGMVRTALCMLLPLWALAGQHQPRG